MTPTQIYQFNNMLRTLKTISKQYQTPNQIRMTCKADYGLNFAESLEMAYENIQELAKNATRNVRILKVAK